MASTETINVLKVDAGQAITTLRELKEAIASDRDALVALGNAEDYTAEKREKAAVITSRLTKENQLLRQVMTASKGMSLDAAKAVDIQTDSYYTLNAALVTLRKEWKELSAAERQEAGGQEILLKIQEVDAELKSLDASIGQYQRNVGNYANSFREALGGIHKSVNGLMTGMAGIAGIIALTGGESEKTTKALAGMQAGMMLLTSAKGFGDFISSGNKATDALLSMKGATTSATAATNAETAATAGLTAGMQAETVATTAATTATQAFKKALISTGIGAIIVALGTLIANLDKLGSLFSSVSEDAKRACDDMVNNIDKVKESLEGQLSVLRESGAVQGEVFDKEVNNLLELRSQYRAYAAEVAKTYGAKSDEYQAALDQVDEAAANLQKKLIAARFAVQGFIAAIDTKEAQKGMTELEKEIDNVTRSAEAYKSALVAALVEGAISEKEYDALVAQLAASRDLAIEQAKDKYIKAEQEKTEAAIKAEQERADAVQKAAEEALKTERERLTEKYQADLALLEKYHKDTTALTEKYAQDIADIEQREQERKEKAAKEEEQRAKAVADAKIKEAQRAADFALHEIDRETEYKLGMNEASEATEREIADKEYEIIKASNEKRLEALKAYKEEAAALGDAEGVLKYEQEIADLSVDIELREAEEKKRIRERDKKDRLAAAKATLSSTSSILGSVADMMEANGKTDAKAQKRAKNLRIAAATIDMLQGATTAYSTAMELGPIFGPIVGAINAAAVITAGLANISQIKSTDTSGDTAASPSASAPPPVVTPEITEVRTLTGASEEERLNQQNRVYILSSDIEASVNDSKVQVAETTF